MTDSGGMQVGLAAYLPFGAPALASGVIDAKRFTGHERDGSGLDYMLARYYNWGWGRFLSVDPSVSSMDPARPQSWNRYTYAMNNPLRFVDPDGAQSVPTTPVTQIVGKYMFHFDPLHGVGQGWHIDVSVKRGGQWTKIGRLVPGEDGLKSLAHLGKSEEVPKAALKALLKKEESFSPKARAVLAAMLEECESLAAAKAALKTAGKVLGKLAIPLAIVTEIAFMEQANASDDKEAIQEANMISLIMFGKPMDRLDGNQLRQLWAELAGGKKLGEGAK
jgi:RHS repeat-associated protein